MVQLHYLIAIAEETKKIAKQLLQIQWQNIVDIRTVLAHDYRGIDLKILVDVITNELPKIKIPFLLMLKKLPIIAVNKIF